MGIGDYLFLAFLTVYIAFWTVYTACIFIYGPEHFPGLFG
jgi:hypothetical protein